MNFTLTNDEVVVAMRYGDDMKALFNYPSQATDETQWRCEELQTRPKQILILHFIVKWHQKLVLNMSKILMVGSGPVAIQLARLCNLHGEHMVDMVVAFMHQPNLRESLMRIIVTAFQ